MPIHARRSVRGWQVTAIPTTPRRRANVSQISDNSEILFLNFGVIHYN